MSGFLKTCSVSPFQVYKDEDGAYLWDEGVLTQLLHELKAKSLLDLVVGTWENLQSATTGMNRMDRLLSVERGEQTHALPGWFRIDHPTAKEAGYYQGADDAEGYGPRPYPGGGVLVWVYLRQRKDGTYTLDKTDEVPMLWRGRLGWYMGTWYGRPGDRCNSPPYWDVDHEPIAQLALEAMEAAAPQVAKAQAVWAEAATWDEYYRK